ncbi:MAG: hypothetical protein R6U96_07630 [Promethearchaeia archaeon]
MIFFIKSDTINLRQFTLKDIPGSSGRLDVVSRNILAALLNQGYFSDNIQIWVFLGKYGTYIFDTDELNYAKFPKSEIKFTDYFVEVIKRDMGIKKINEKKIELLDGLINSNQKILSALEDLKNKEYEIYILKETGEELSKFMEARKIPEKSVFLIGNQQGDFIESTKLAEYNFKELSLGKKSYLGSHTIRLIKIILTKKENLF